MKGLEPPWVLFTDKGRPIAILPAGRPGEVANIEGLSLAQANAIVRAASEGAFEQKLDSLIGAMQKATKELGNAQLMRDALSLLESYEWQFEDRGGEGEWNICHACWAEFHIGAKDKPHKPDCQWVSTVEGLRKGIG
jgi:hypothetical protein